MYRGTGKGLFSLDHPCSKTKGSLHRYCSSGVHSHGSEKAGPVSRRKRDEIRSKMNKSDKIRKTLKNDEGHGQRGSVIRESKLTFVGSFMLPCILVLHCSERGIANIGVRKLDHNFQT